ncbi:MAG: glycosyltransferase family 4 protein [Gemmataceae bacterium]|nr:glycosyltransferase family 4 protein [Gemmataceae bacterium]
MRICLYTETALPKIGGQEFVVDALARQFQALGHEPTVLAPHPRLPLRARDQDLPYPVIRHPRFFSTRLFVSWYRWFLTRAHRRKQFDVVHCHSIYPQGWLAGLAKAKLGIPIAITSHGGDVNPHSHRANKRSMLPRYVEACKQADALIAISRFTEDGYRRLCPDHLRIVRIPNGVDFEKFVEEVPRPQGLEERIRSRGYVFFLGRLRRRKGVDVLLDAYSQLPADSLPLVIAGDGEERAALEAQSKRLGIADRVVFLGSVGMPLKAYLYRNALFTAVPSREWEAFGLVVLESFASATPVIATNLAGLEDLIQPSETGLTAPPENASLLRDAMARLLADPRETLRMGEAARRYAADFTWREIARKHVELFEQLKARSPAAPR